VLANRRKNSTRRGLQPMVADSRRQNMRVLVCHPQSLLLHMAKLNAERRGVEVELVRSPRDVQGKAQARRPNLIVLGPDLKDPSSEELATRLRLDPHLRGTEVMILKGNLTDLLKTRFGPMSAR